MTLHLLKNRPKTRFLKRNENSKTETNLDFTKSDTNFLTR